MPADADLVRAYHIWDAAREAIDYARGRRREDLDADRPLQHSLVRMLEVIGEAASGTSHPFRKAHPGVPWQQMVGMRNRLIHAYFDINLDVVRSPRTCHPWSPRWSRSWLRPACSESPG